MLHISFDRLGIFFFLHDDTQNYATTNLEMTVNVFFQHTTFKS